jgi:hypothetical protein
VNSTQESAAATARADSSLRVVRVAGIALFALWVARYMTSMEPLLHGSLLIFHEAGHVFFMPFGEFLMVLGGSLFQLMVPAFFVAYFARRHDPYAACFAALYLAASLAGVAFYVADARAGELPLLGGDRASHDWTFLLIEMGMLQHDRAIGRFLMMIGWLLFMGALALGLRAAWLVGEPDGDTSARQQA